MNNNKTKIDINYTVYVIMFQEHLHKNLDTYIKKTNMVNSHCIANLIYWDILPINNLNIYC